MIHVCIEVDLFFFVTRQYAMHAERSIVLPDLFTCLSVSLTNAGTVSK